MAHVDVLEQPERLAKPFWGSLILHISIAGALAGYAWLGVAGRVQWGDPKGGGIGAVAVGVTANIPLPSRGGRENPLANDTESRAPEAPAKKKAQPKVKAPEPEAIPLKSRDAEKKAARTPASTPNKWREQQHDLPNQVYSSSGQALSSSMYSLSGGGGVGVGNNSPFGSQFGWYATLLRDKVAQNWKTSDLGQVHAASGAVVVFTILRDGSLAPGSVKISQTSGDRALDFSALRAVADAAPFARLPDGFPRTRADIELRFELRR